MLKATKPIITGTFLLLLKTTSAQIVPNTNTVSAAQEVKNFPHSFYGSGKINWVRTWEPWKPITVDSLVPIDSIPNVKIATAYVDGLGRVIETVSKQNSPNRKDMVSFKALDDYGRETLQYLPYPSDSSSGYFFSNPSVAQKTYFSTSSKNNNQYQGEQVYYGQTIFETSPLGRPDTVMSPGNSWAGNNRGVRYQYLINTTSDSVRIWTIADAEGSVPSTSSSYLAGELYKTVTIDEQGKQVIEYKDKEGKVILKKVQLLDSPTSGYYGWQCTYYIYDNYGLLRYVIQPKGVDWLYQNSWSLTSTLGTHIKTDQCFIYEYDQRNRMISKKVPGAGEVYMVYDARDRVVMTQDANLRNQNKWLYTEYDASDRPVATGILTSSSNRATHQSSAYSSTSYPNLGSYTHEELTRTYYDNYDWTSSTGNASSFISTYSSNTTYFITPSNTTAPYAQPVSAVNLTYGLATGNKTEILAMGGDASQVVFYDSKNRVIQTQTYHYRSGADTITNQYDFSGKLLRSLICHVLAPEVFPTYKILTKLEYDAAGRLITTKKIADASEEVTIAQNSYDELGQLKSKAFEPEYNSYAGLETLKYEYNIRGWLKSINKEYVDSTVSHWFGQTLSYDWGFSTQQYNGNISGIKWKSKGDLEKRAYGFAYDNANRFLKADFTQYTSSSWNTTAGIDFSVKMGNASDPTTAYDANGNILKMNQKGWKLGGSVTIDSLSYTYGFSDNKLSKVTDAVSDANTKLGDFHDGTNGSSDDYYYDDNGNLTMDNNKAISSIHYNHLNLPDTITVTSKGTIIYIYDAAGTKLEKQVVEGSTTTITDYINGFEYKNDTLQQIAHEEGRIRSKADTAFVYDYFIKDHLGNVRMVLTDEQQTDAYPAATMESENATIEESLYINVAETRSELPTNYPDDNYTQENRYVAKIDPGTRALGPGILLRVMSGDKFNLRVSDWYDGRQSDQGGEHTIASEVVSALLNGIPVMTNGHPSQTELDNSGILSTSIGQFFTNQGGGNTSKPRAFVNWILLDEHFNLVGSSSGFEQVGNENTLNVHTKTDMPVDKNGYLYIFVSNENADPKIIYFDNLQVTHIRGPLVEESHYYPFGLQINGISSKALNFGSPENKKNKFQNQEYNDDLGVDIYEFKYRMDDPQIGRFWQVDPKADDYRYNSLYAFSENRVIDGRELEGLEYASIHHYANGSIGTKMFYKSTDKEINERGGTTSGLYNSASYGPLGKGVVHYYYNSKGEIYDTRWDQRQTGGTSDLMYHGLYSGPGSITTDGGENSKNYDYTFQPIDWADAIAKRHDHDYYDQQKSDKPGDVQGLAFLEDIRTVQADRDMVQRIEDYRDLFKDVKGVETPYRTSWSGEMELAMTGQSVLISALATYKQWKIDHGYGNQNTYTELNEQFRKDNKLVALLIDAIPNSKK